MGDSYAVARARAGHPESVSDVLRGVTCLDELNALSEALRNPPQGVQVKAVTADEWAEIARLKIELQKRERR